MGLLYISMKKSLLISLLSIFSFSFLISQTGDEKRDHVWLFGYTDVIPPAPLFGNITLNFNESPFKITEVGVYINFSETNSSICDKDGNLLAYTNGISIGNRAGEVMANGSGLSPGGLTTIWQEWGMIMPEGALILPMPESDNLYIVLHGLFDWIDGIGYCCTKWFYSMVDMEQQNGQGMVVEKNVEILSDTLAVGNLAATRHGNGRDWWLLIPEYNTNVYYNFLLTPEGLIDKGPQAVGMPVGEGVGQALFSPDGTKYARNEMIDIGQDDIVSLYDFDRCTGLLSSPSHLPYGDGAYAGGLAFSPNSKFLYIPHSTKILQLDMEEPDILSALDTVAVWDTFFSPSPPFATLFNLASLAPDGKIYINSPNSTDRLHVIHEPDKKGIACNVDQNAIELPVYNSFSLPTYPNFRLGKWEDSPCDTIEAVGTTAAFPFSKIYVYPNPASEYVIYDNSHSQEKITRVLFYNNMGEIISEKKWDSYLSEYEMDVSGLVAGIYFYSVFGEENILKSGKIIVQRE